MRVYFMRICVILLSISWNCAQVTIENGGYNVLVAFSQNVPFKTWMEIEKIKTSLEEASQILHNAIGLQFSKVTFEIPESWNTTEYDTNIEDSFNSDSVKADILIDNTEDTVFGKFPFAQQYGSCGVPGYQLIVPSTFFQDVDNFPKGIALAREWLKYQYGVFDENGYLGDSLYPAYYHIPGGNGNEVRVTDCANLKITYNFTDQSQNECPFDKMLIDKLKRQECALSINEENLENITSSLMYFQKIITSMTHICGRDDDHKHNSRSPNKQNKLCYEKSIWEVVSQSRNYKKEEVKEESSAVEFVFTKKAKPRVVLAWENMEKLRSKGEIILNAIRKLIIDLPNGSKFKAFPFDEEGPDKDTDDNPELDVLDDITSRIGIKVISNFLDKGDGNFKEAIKKGISILKKDAAENQEEPSGNIIIIAGTEDNLTVVSLKDLNLCLETYDESSVPDNIAELKSNLPCFEVIRIPMAEKREAIYEKLVEAIERNCPSKFEDKLTEMLKTEYIYENSSLIAEVDGYTETVTFTIFSDIDKESKRFILTLNGVKVGKKTEVRYEKVLQLSYTIKEAGTLNFSFPHPTSAMLVEAKKTSKPGKYISGKVTVHDTTGEKDKDQMPVIIYTIIRFGSYPVQNANVSAIIQRPDGEEIYLDLNDDGKGDPDITQNDGVYSRYFTNFNSEGDYIVTVTVSNNGFATTYGADQSSGYNSCCGSKVDLGTTKLTQFTRVFQTTFSAKSGRPDDGYKPSRITDLTIGEFTEDGITLRWTAPGEEADSGTVQSYEIKSFTSPEEAKNNFKSGVDLFNYTSPKERGEPEEINISYGAFEKNGLYYIAMKAKNSKKESDLSTIVEVYVSNAETTDAPDERKDDDEIKIGKTSPKTIGLIVGLIVGLMILMILIYVIIYFVIVKPKRKKKEQKDNPIYESSRKTESNVLNPINFVSADTLIRHHNEKVKAKSENKEPPIFKEDDFEDRTVQPKNKASASSNDQEEEINYKSPRNGQLFPPKSPKRITPV